MLNFDELVLDNWVHHLPQWSYRNEQADKEFDFQWNQSDWYALGECTLLPDVIQPIIITEEWLFKLNLERFEIVDSFWLNKDWGIYYSIYNQGIRIIDKGWICDVKYVHQLQNFYYSIKGDKLT